MHWVHAEQGTFLQLNSDQIFEFEAAENDKGLYPLYLQVQCNIKMQNGKSFKSTVKRLGAEKWIKERTEKQFICENITPMRSARKRWNRPAIWNFEYTGVNFDLEALY